MSVIESSGLIKSKDTEGNMNIIYPVTTKENVDGLEEFDAHLINTENPHSVTIEQIGAAPDTAEIQIVTATSTDGVAYTATVPHYDALTIGKKIIIIPDFTSTVVNPTLNVNGLGDKYFRCPLTTNNSATSSAASASWIVKTKPLEIMWNGTFWVTNLFRPDANTIYGTIKIENGGTGGVTAEAARTNLEVYSKSEVDAAIQAAWADVIVAEEASF